MPKPDLLRKIYHRNPLQKTSGFMNNPNLIRKINNAQQWIPLRVYLKVAYKILFCQVYFCCDTSLNLLSDTVICDYQMILIYNHFDCKILNIELFGLQGHLNMALACNFFCNNKYRVQLTESIKRI